MAIIYGTNNPDTLTGNEGEGDEIYGLDGRDILYGLGGDDVLRGGLGEDQLYGGPGNDRLYGGADQGGASYPGNVLSGGEGDDYLDGESTIVNILAGGPGDDTYVFRGYSPALTRNSGHDGDAIAEAFGEGVDTILAYVSLTKPDSRRWFPENVEIVRLIGVNAIQAVGDGAANTLIGNEYGNALDGGLGVDTMIGGDGVDSYWVRDLGDRVVENPGEGINDEVFSYITDYTLPANTERLYMHFYEAQNVYSTSTYGRGNELDNAIFGDYGPNVLIGGAGSDIMVGGADNDDYEVREVGDLVYENGPGIDTVYSYLSQYTLPDLVERLFLIDTAVTGKGNRLNNTIIGNAEANILDGGGGDDALTGGGGLDTFYWGGALAGRAGITDFDAAGGEQIIVSARVFANYAALQAAETQVGPNVVITVNAATSLTLVGVSVGQLSASNFQFYDGPE